MRCSTILLFSLVWEGVRAEDLPDGAELERDSAFIGEIRLDKSNVYDLANPDENNWLYRFFMTVLASIGKDLDIDQPVQLGGDTGLRGYPLRYQSGESKALVTIEQRYFTDWYPFRLLRIGGAVFADAGRVWGPDSLAGRRFGWLADVGLGLRFAPTRSRGKILVHLDIAFPLGGEASIDSVQFLLESK